METASLYGRPAARFATLYANSHSKSNPFKERQFNDAQMFLWIADMEEHLTPRAAKSFMRCQKANRVPEWVYKFVDEEAIADYVKVISGD